MIGLLSTLRATHACNIAEKKERNILKEKKILYDHRLEGGIY